MENAAGAPMSSPLINVRDYGATGDGDALDTRALQAAVDACGVRGGGTVFFPAGRYRSGTVVLRSRVTLHLDAGAVLLGSEDPDDYPVEPGRWEGAEQAAHAALIAGRGLSTIAVTGRGMIDGCGEVWWKRFAEKTLTHPRPRLISFADCENVLVEGITLVNSPSWTVHPVRCTNVNVRGVTILNPPDSPNTDGINPDSCRAVRISDCYVSAGDDCIAIKAGAEHERADRRASCRDVTIVNCTLARGHGGVVIGSETNGGVQNVTIANCVFTGTDRGIRFKSRRGRGGVIEDIRVSNLVMTDVLCPVTVNLYYACGAWGDARVSDRRPLAVDAGTPRIRRVHLSQITAREVKVSAGFLFGLAEMPVEEFTLDDVSISLSADPRAGYPEMADGLESEEQAGFFIRNARRLTLRNVEISGQRGPAFRLMDSNSVRIEGCGSDGLDESDPVFSMRNAADVCLRDCRGGKRNGLLLDVAGPDTAGILVSGGPADPDSKSIRLAADVPKGAVRRLPSG